MRDFKVERIVKKIKSAEALIEIGLYLDAASLYWQASRDYMFFWLTKHNVEYDSTNEALRQIIQLFDKDSMSKIVIEIEIIGTLSEWDEFFDMSKEQVIDFKNNCISVLKYMGYDGN